MRPQITSSAGAQIVTSEVDHARSLSEPQRFRAIICQETVQACLKSFGANLRAIILTGSLARHEATFIAEEECWVLLGDAEFMLIFQDGASLPSGVDLQSLYRSIEGSIFGRGIRGLITLATVHPRYLRKLRPHIFAYELRHCGQVLWGDSRILTLIPVFSVSDIPLEDAWCLVCNRMLEQLQVICQCADTSRFSGSLFYRTVKLYLDLATSFLLFKGKYAPSYLQRGENLKIVADEASEKDGFPFDVKKFAERVTACTDWKLSGLGATHLTHGDRAETVSWEEAIAYAQLLWRWELAQLTGSQQQLSNRELMQRWMKQQLPYRRLRGWLYVLRSQGWYRSWRQWPHWARLAWRASPRYWVYDVASEICFRLPCLLKSDGHRPQIDINWEEVQGRLPVVRHMGPARRSPTKPNWQQVASDSVANYHEFLVGTRS